MNNKLLATAAFMSITLGAFSAPIYTVLDLNSSLLIQNDSSEDSLESYGEKLLALNRPKNKKSKKEVEEEEVEEDDEETSEDDSEDEGEDSDDSDDGEDEGDEAGADTDSDDGDDDDDDDDDGADYTDDGDENDEPSNGNGFGDIKSQLDNKNSTLPESKSDFHVHKNAPHNTVTNKLDPQGSVQEYITYLYGDEIILKHTLIFRPNGTYNIDANVKANYKTITPASVVSNTRQQGNLWITEFTYYGGKIKSTFTLTPLGNNVWGIDYKWRIIDPNI
jgi:hypothetical protein